MSGSRRRSARLTAGLLVAVLGIAGAAVPAPISGQSAGTATVGPFTFQTGPYQLLTLPEQQLPYYSTRTIIGCGYTDGNGVAMYRDGGGVVHNHPVAQAQCALNMLRNYRLVPDPRYLETSIANAQRLLSRSVTHRGGLFFPYSFAWSNSFRSVMQPPWYSSMSQGLALMAFLRLHDVTGQARWMDAAHRTFASYKVSRSMAGPWHVAVENGQLWLDEYPSTPPDKVFNGHNFSLYGLYEYWRVTGSSEASALVRGALHASYVGGSTRIRVPGGISHYCASNPCIAHAVRNPAYHSTHIGQLTYLFRFTGHWHFASMAEAFTADSPRPTSGRAQLASGTHHGYSFDSQGNGTRVRTVSFAATTTVQYSRREVPGGQVRPGNGIWLRIAEGALSGLWVRESGSALPLGFTDVLALHWNRSVHVEAGLYTAHTYDGNAVVTASSTATALAETWTYNEYRRVNGRPSVLLTSGPMTGQWLALDWRTTRDTTLFTDIDASVFRGDIIWLTDHAITVGCATYRYCPTAVVRRQHMASFLARALALPAAERDHFIDDEGSPYEADINRLADAGITDGCGAGRFCPDAGVTRGEMASFLARAFALPDTSEDAFIDDETSIHEADINRLAAAGITTGCSEVSYCPDAGVTRGEMAAFLRRGLVRLAGSIATVDEPPPSPAPTPGPSTSIPPEPSPPAAPTPPGASPSEASPSGAPTPTPTPLPSPMPDPSASAEGDGSGPSPPTPRPSSSGGP